MLSTLACKVSLQNRIFQLACQVISGRFLSRFLQKYPLSRWLNDWRIFNWLLFSQLGLVVFLPAIMPESCRFRFVLSLIQAINFCFLGSNRARVLQVSFVLSIHQLEQYLTFQIMPVWHDLKCKILTLRVLQVWSLLQFYQLDF